MTGPQQPSPAAAPDSDNRRLDRLLRADKRRPRHDGRGHSRLVRALRLLLPLAAVGIVGLVVSWPRVEERLAPPPQNPAATPQTVGHNELIDPRFESEDQQNRPFTVTAARAVQSSTNPDIVFLEQPAGTMRLDNGATLTAQAVKGAFDQKAETLLLEGDVTMDHDNGYRFVTEKLRVDLGPRTAWADTLVRGDGPDATLRATGVKADIGQGEIIFTGPATLTLRRALNGL